MTAANKPKKEKPPQEDMATTIALLKRLLRDRIRRYLGQYITAFLLLTVVAVTTSLTAWIMKDVINEIFVEQSRSAVVWLPLAVATIFIVKGLCAYYSEVILARVGTSLIAETQNNMFAHLLSMDAGYYQKQQSSQLITQLTYCANAVKTMIDVTAMSLGRDLLTVIGLIIVMAIQDPMLFGIVALFGPIAVYGMRKLSKKIRNVTESEAPAQAKIVEVMRETSQGIRIVKSFQLETPIRERMQGAVLHLADRMFRIRRIQARVNPLMETLAGIAIAIVVGYAGWRAISSAETPGEFFAFTTALLLAAEPARRLSKAQIQLSTAAVGVRMMYDLLDQPAREAQQNGLPPLEISRGKIVFDDVSFDYGNEMPVLKSMSFEAPAGKTTALVGASGGGKSTVFNLIERFWEPTSGSIRIDKTGISTVSLSSLRSQISLVSQDVFLFEGTVKDNIWAGRPDATEDDVIAAAKAAYAHDFIRQLKDGYDSAVGELGSKISGGQRQRISLARAFLKAAPIILLDEPTSALDSETEQIIQTALDDLTRGKTTLVIAHRLATVRNADVIHVIDKGRVAESGTHQALLENGKLYSRLYDMQFESA
jgi:ATP-binding cassette, subfamily B, bacterial MsbA